MLGTGIFMVFPTLAASRHPSVFFVLATWAAGTLVAWFGAMCFAELACIFPVNGGEYVFLREAYSHRGLSPLSFLFAWAQIFVIRPASLVSLAIVFGLSGGTALSGFFRALAGFPLPALVRELLPVFLAAGTPVVFTIVSIRGIRLSKNVQNALSLVKVSLLLLIIVYGLYRGRTLFSNLSPFMIPGECLTGRFFLKMGMALIPVMWVFGGWNEAPYVGGEIRDPVRSIPRALTFGILGLGLLYLMVNFVYLLHLTPEGLSETWNVASELMKRWFGLEGEVVMATVIAVSAAGAVNGLILTGGRMTAAFARDFGVLASIGRVHPRYRTPGPALLVNLAITLLIAHTVDLDASSIETLLLFTAGVVWIFFALVVGSVFLFRRRLDSRDIPFKMPFYPVPHLIFLVMCGFMIWGALDYRARETLGGISILAAGVGVYYAGVLARRVRRSSETAKKN